jgi:hypothetical protein
LLRTGPGLCLVLGRPEPKDTEAMALAPKTNGTVQKYSSRADWSWVLRSTLHFRTTILLFTLLWSDIWGGVKFTRYSNKSSSYISRLCPSLFQGRLRSAAALLFAAGRYRRRKAPATVRHLQPETIPDRAPCAKHCTMWSLVTGHQALAHWSHSALQQTDQCNFKKLAHRSLKL